MHALRRQLHALDDRLAHRIRYGDDRRRVRQQPAIKRIALQRQVMMPGEHETHAVGAAAGERRHQIIAPDVRVNQVNAMLIHEIGDGMRRLQIERIAQRHLVPRSDDARQRLAQRAARAHGEIDGMTTRRERPHQSGDVNLAAAHFACRTDL